MEEMGASLVSPTSPSLGGGGVGRGGVGTLGGDRCREEGGTHCEREVTGLLA